MPNPVWIITKTIKLIPVSLILCCFRNNNGNKQPNTFEQFACITSSLDLNSKAEKNSALPYYGADVSSIFSQLDKPANQAYDWSKFKLGGIPSNNMESSYGHMDKPIDQSYDWSKFNLLGTPIGTANVKSIYGDLVPPSCKM